MQHDARTRFHLVLKTRFLYLRSVYKFSCSSSRSSWDDVWEETSHIPRRLVATQAKKAAEKASREIVRKSRERSDKETDTWRDVENE